VNRPTATRWPLPLPRDLSGQVDLFLRARSATALLQVPVELWREDRLLIQFSLESLYWGAYFGVLCALVIYNLFLFLSPSGFGLRLLRAVHRLNQPSDALYLRTRERLDLGRAAVGAPLCPAHQHRTCVSVWLDVRTQLSEMAGYFCPLGSQHENRGRTGRGLFVYTWTDPINGALFAGLLSTLVLVLVIAVGLVCLKAGVAIARYFVLAWTAFALGTALYLLNVFDFLPVNLVTNHALQVGSVAELLLLSFALAHRIKDERARKLAALRKQQMAERQVRDLEMQSLEEAMHDSTTRMPNASPAQSAVTNNDESERAGRTHAGPLSTDQGHCLQHGPQSGRRRVLSVDGQAQPYAGGGRGVVCLESRQPAYIAIPEFGSAAFLLDLKQFEGPLEPFIAQVVGNHEISVHAVRLPVFMNLHCGVAVAPEHGDSPEILYQHALAARDRSESSKVPVQLFNDEISDFARRRLDLLTVLPPAIEAGNWSFTCNRKWTAPARSWWVRRYCCVGTVRVLGQCPPGK